LDRYKTITATIAVSAKYGDKDVPCRLPSDKDVRKSKYVFNYAFKNTLPL